MRLKEASEIVLKSPLGKELSESHLVQLMLAGTIASFTPGSMIFRRGEQSDGTFCIVIGGEVALVDDKTGDSLRRFDAGTLLGEVALLNPDAKRTATVCAVDEVEVIQWRRDELAADLFAALEPALESSAWPRIANDLT